MKITKILMAVGIAAIPLWYAYRTVTEKRIRHLEWPEVFMTEAERQAKWAEEKQKAKEEAEAERVQKATELEKATAARKSAEVEAAKAEAEVAQKRVLITIETDRRMAEQAAARSRAESETAAKTRTLTGRVQVCANRTKEAEASLRIFLEQQKEYRAFTDEALRLPYPAKGPVARDRFTDTFRTFYRESLLGDGDAKDLARAQRTCEEFAGKETEGDYGYKRSIEEIESLAKGYEHYTESLKASRSEIQNLVDYAMSRVPDTLGGQVIKDRMVKAINDAYLHPPK